MKKIILLLSTYNGERYLNELLVSLLKQTRKFDLLLVRDDGSTDNTLKILQRYNEEYENIELCQADNNNLGASASFNYLLKKALDYNPDYVMFADQDDVWKHEKIEITYNRMLLIEKDFATPALVFTDSTLTDAKLNILQQSFIQSQKFYNASMLSFKFLLLHSCALGCTMMLNRSLIEKCLCYDGSEIYYDKWYVINALIYGRVSFLPVQTLYQRRHETNATALQSGGIHKKLMKQKMFDFIKNRYQACLFEALLLQRLIPNDNRYYRQISQLIRLFTGNRLQRIYILLKFINEPPHWKRKLGLMLSLFCKFQIKNNG